MVCKVCDYKDPDRCITCGEGYRLSVQDDYTCIPCDQTTCATCDFQQGSCETCKKGFYSDGLGGCLPCREFCGECSSLDNCLECTHPGAMFIHPDDGVCLCYNYSGWYEKPDQDNPYDC